MAKLIWAVTCSRVITDAASNLVSYIDLLDSVALPTFPTKAPMTVVASIWEPEQESSLVVRAKAFAPDGTLLLSGNAATFELDPGFKRVRFANGLAGFEVAQPGTYYLGLELQSGKEWVEVTRIPLRIDRPTPPTQT